MLGQHPNKKNLANGGKHREMLNNQKLEKFRKTKKTTHVLKNVIQNYKHCITVQFL